MDVYSTSFTYPRKSRHIRSPASSLDYQPPDLRPSVSDPFASPTHHHHHLPQSDVALPADADAIQKIAMMAMSLHGCHVSYLLADHARAWNFYVSGAYQQVMATRGMILKECPIQVCLSLFSQSFRPLTCCSIMLLSKLHAQRSLISRPQSRRSSPKFVVALTILLPRRWPTLPSSTVLLLFPTGLLPTASAAAQDGRVLRQSVSVSWSSLGLKILSIWRVFGYSSCWTSW